ncbi:hypothetical protein HCN44_006919 [Aphidius gifuensis]|uniref:Uncharacterized protein n=1 Tax=Aphidius gifuensis TaxID=684658 RepID=A0A834Y324_APHGI|nr:hypothetical protein HCN44_006919 [Aphidius gifuensis]
MKHCCLNFFQIKNFVLIIGIFLYIFWAICFIEVLDFSALWYKTGKIFPNKFIPSTFILDYDKIICGIVTILYLIFSGFFLYGVIFEQVKLMLPWLLLSTVDFILDFIFTVAKYMIALKNDEPLTNEKILLIINISLIKYG